MRYHLSHFTERLADRENSTFILRTLQDLHPDVDFLYGLLYDRGCPASVAAGS